MFKRTYMSHVKMSYLVLKTRGNISCVVTVDVCKVADGRRLPRLAWLQHNHRTGVVALNFLFGHFWEIPLCKIIVD